MTDKQCIATLEKAERLLRKAVNIDDLDQASHIGGLRNAIGNSWRLTKRALEAERKRQEDARYFEGQRFSGTEVR